MPPVRRFSYPRSILPALITLFCLLAAGPAHTQSATASFPPTPLQGLGVNIHFTGAPAQDLDGLKSLGVHWARMDLFWDRVERTKGGYDFSAYDTLAAALAARQIHPLFILDYGNDLYQKGAPIRPDARDAFARFAAAAARHFMGRGVVWEIWNEPNADTWKPVPNAQDYAALAVEAARAMKVADPFAVIIAPATSGVDTDFEEACFQAGLLRYIDGISFHPYRDGPPETAGADYDRLRTLLEQYAPAGKQYALVSSEWGYSTAAIGEDQQAQYLTRQWLCNIEQGIAISVWYDWQDDGADPKNPEYNFGMVRADYSRKPAFLAARTLIRAFYGYRFIKRVPLGAEGDYLLVFARGGSYKLAAWSTGAAHAILLPFSGVAHVTHLLSDSEYLPAKAGLLNLPISQSPEYVDVPSGNEAIKLAASWSVAPSHGAYMGEDPAIGVDFINPLNRPLVVSLCAGPLPAKVAIPATAAKRVPPGQSVHFTLHVKTIRLPVHANLMLNIVQGGRPVPQPLGAGLDLVPGDPIKLSVVPAPGGGYFATIENPAGEALSGRLTQVELGQAQSVPFELSAGARQATVWVMGLTGDPWKSMYFVLADEHGSAVSWQPPARFAPYSSSPSDWQAVLDGDLKVASKVGVTAVPAEPFAATGAQITYSFGPGWTFWRLTDPKAKPLKGEPLAVVLWVWGDKSGDLLRMRYIDATGQTFQAHASPCDWEGWRPVTFTLSGSGHWGGKNDGVVHYPITLNSLLVLDPSSSRQPASGSILVCDPMIVYQK